MKCLIIAASQESRLSQKGDSNPLIPPFLWWGETPIIEHVIGSVTAAEINSFCVMTEAFIDSSWGEKRNEVPDYSGRPGKQAISEG